MGGAPGKGHRGQVGRHHRELEHQLLALGQAQVALFQDADVVIHKTDGPKGHRHAQAREGLGLEQHSLRQAQGIGDGQADYHGDGDAQNEHQPAHGGGALLVLVPAGAHFPDGLAKLQLVQEGNHPLPQGGGDGKGYHRNQQIQHGAHYFPTLSRCVSSLLGRGDYPPAVAPVSALALSTKVKVITVPCCTCSPSATLWAVTVAVEEDEPLTLICRPLMLAR